MATNPTDLVVVDAVRDNGRGMVNIAVPREEAAAYPKWRLWNAREREERTK